MKRRAVIVLITSSVLILAGPVALVSANAATPSIASWRQEIGTRPPSGPGCFGASFPSSRWRSVPCQEAPVVPFGPRTGAGNPATVGDGVDYSAVASGGLLQSVTGSFPYVSPGTSETGVVGPGDPSTANTFSLQLNSSFFAGSPACAGAAEPSVCQGWQQFVLATDPTHPPKLFMQYWLITYGNTCPTGWRSGGSGNCFMNSDAATPPALTASQLSDVSLEGSVSAGGSDVVTLTLGTQAYAVSNSDSVVGLASNWSTAEFGVFGDGNNSQARFSAGTTIRVMTATDDGTTLAPSCSLHGFTGETNNLRLVRTPGRAAGSTPGIISEQSNVPSSSATCVTSPRNAGTSLQREPGAFRRALTAPAQVR